MGAPQPAHLGAAHLGLAHCAVGWLSPACPPGLQEASFLGAEPPNPSLSHRLGFSWEGLAQFPEPPKDGQHPDMDDPVTVRTVQRYTKALVEEAKLRAAWFQTPHVLWPWVSSVPGPLAASQTRRDPSGLGPALTGPVSAVQQVPAGLLPSAVVGPPSLPLLRASP